MHQSPCFGFQPSTTATRQAGSRTAMDGDGGDSGAGGSGGAGSSEVSSFQVWL